MHPLMLDVVTRGIKEKSCYGRYASKMKTPLQIQCKCACQKPHQDLIAVSGDTVSLGEN